MGWLTKNVAEPEGVLTLDTLMEAAEVIRNERDRSDDPFLCPGGIDGYFMSYMFISPRRQRIVHPNVARQLAEMTDAEYDRRMEKAKRAVLEALD